MVIDISYNYYSCFDTFITLENQENFIIYVNFIIDKVKSILHYYNAKEIRKINKIEIKKHVDIDKAEYFPAGNQTYFVLKIPIEIDDYFSIVAKPYTIQLSALIQYLASFQIFTQKNFRITYDDKIVEITVAKPFFLEYFIYELGKTTKEIPILVQEGVDCLDNITTYFTRKDLSNLVRKLAEENFIFDSYPSNWKIKSVNQIEDKKIFNLCYIDIFYSTNYSLIKPQIIKILSQFKQ